MGFDSFIYVHDSFIEDDAQVREGYNLAYWRSFNTLRAYLHGKCYVLNHNPIFISRALSEWIIEAVENGILEDYQTIRDWNRDGNIHETKATKDTFERVIELIKEGKIIYYYPSW